MRLFGLLVMVFLSYYNHSTNKKSIFWEYSLASICNQTLPLSYHLTDCLTHSYVLGSLLIGRFSAEGTHAALKKALQRVFSWARLAE